MARFIKALPTSEVTRTVRRATVGRRPVLLTRLGDGTPVAFAPVCPHEGNPLDEAQLWEDKLDCPFHHYTYDLRTGENAYPACVFPASKRAELRDLVLFQVEERDGWVWVGPRRRSASGE